MARENASLNLIREKIKETSAEWKAGKTSISDLSPDALKRRLGVIPTGTQLSAISKLGLNKELVSRSFDKTKVHKSENRTVGLPNKMDWRDIQGVDWTTPIKDQGNCGSCVAFGTVADLEVILKIRYYNDPDKEIDLSEAHLLWCGGGSCDGWNMDEACDFLKKKGVPDEDCFSYHDTPMSCQDTCPDWESKIGHTKISEWSNIFDINTMKDNIANNGPQITGMAVYTDFFYYKSGIYQHAWGGLEGYHCISVVGFDDEERCWICKNSWDTGWGESGFFKIAYGECGIEDVFGMWNLKIEGYEEDQGEADSVSIDYSFASFDRILKVNAGGKEFHKQISDEDLVGIAKLLMESTKVQVKWSGEELVSVKCIKKY